ncbi:tRNA lysidine(34) synthetase TilS [uncultured Fibrobacter sp.]|uniref:tRNA lysidine(34) synthetase TilS n=1 Tax=uncultured Fibrobacter sp. TaxID=261512 RepID=UPI0025F005A2|nr:tRNA lysidine(34) synthetase TilS [uncultured Fibrobacter sp.]
MSFNLIENIRHYGFKRLLLAVSGGLDSICLAHYFIENKEALGIEWLGIAHVHHGLREGTADRDAAFVEAFAKSHNVPFFLKKLDGEALKAMDGSLEENARDARYKALVEIAHSCEQSAVSNEEKEIPASAGMTEKNVEPRAPSLEPRTSIVTAHHAGDQAETMFMRLRRGTTLAGLRGIQEIRVLGNSQGVAGLASEAPLEGVMEDRATGCNQGDTSPLIINHPSSIINHQSKFIYRPFLSVTREDLLAYAREHNLTWCEDESNSDVKFARNKVRHELLPQLENACPGATAQLCSIASLANRAYKKVLDAADKLYAPAIVPPDTWPFEASCAKYGKVLALDAGALASIPPYPELLRLWLDSRGFRFPIDTFAKPNPIYTGNPQTLRTLSFRTRFIEKCRHIVWIYDSNTILEPSNLYFSNEKQRFSGISGQWRHPQQGDILSPMDMKISPRKLAEWLQEKGIPRWERDSLQVFAQGTRVLFVSGIRTENLKRKGLK